MNRFSMITHNILFISPSLEPQNGGIQVSGKLALQALSVKMNQLGGTLCHFSYGENKESHADINNINHIHVSSRIRAAYRAFSIAKDSSILLFWHLDLLKLLPFFQTVRLKTIVFLHGIECWKKQSWFNRFALGKVDHFLSNSSFTWNNFLKHNPQFRDKSHRTIHLGLKSPVERKLKVPQDPPVAVMIGRMSKQEDYKGHREMINAWPDILKRKPNAELWILGQGDLQPDLEDLAKQKGIKNYVTFWGWVSGKRKDTLLEKSRLLALPSRGEGFGLVYLEAMRLGRPCLVSKCDAAREVVDPPRAGLEVNPENIEEVVNATCELLSMTSEWQRMSRVARQRYENRFTADCFQKRLLSAVFDRINH